MILGAEEPKPTLQPKQSVSNPLAPKMVDEIPMPEIEDAQIDMFFMEPAPAEESKSQPVILQLKIKEDDILEAEKEKRELEEKKQKLNDKFDQLRQSVIGNITSAIKNQNSFPAPAASGGYLARPSNIYADSKPEVFTSKPAEKPVPAPPVKIEEEETFSMQLVIRNDIPAADEPTATQTLTPANFPADEPAMQDAAGEEKRKAAERLQKLRNLSFNINAADPNNEFEAVPAYIRRNMEFYNQTASVEDFYSNYSVKAGDNNQQAQISTINTFLDGKKPD